MKPVKPQQTRSEVPSVLAPDGIEYVGPVVVSAIEIAGRPFRLVRPADPDLLLDDPLVADRNRRDDYMPYWAHLWPAAYLLAEAVAREAWPERPAGPGAGEALEIGCGLGLPGLVALARGLHVQFTDYDQTPLDFVVRSAAENGFARSRFSTRVLDWRDLPDERYPIVLGADVIYEAGLVRLVATALARLLAPGGLGLLASPSRIAAGEFPAAVKAVGLICRTEAVTARSDDGRVIEGTLYRVTH